MSSNNSGGFCPPIAIADYKNNFKDKLRDYSSE
jgi:hypothetical protein